MLSLSKYLRSIILASCCLLSALTVKSEIISDTIVLNIRNAKFEFIRYDFDRILTVVITNSEELTYFSEIDIPFSFDPTRIYHNSVIENRGEYYSNIRIDFFNTVKNGKLAPELYEKKEISADILQNIPRYYGKYEKYRYSTGDIKIGDTLEFNVRYYMTLMDNMESLESYRIFLNGQIPKSNCTFILSHLKELKINMNYGNLVKPDSSFNDGLVKYTWDLNNLNSNIEELNSIAFVELPFVTFTPLPERFTYKLPNPSFDRLDYRLNAYFSLYREYNTLDTKRSANIGSVNKSFSSLYRYINNFQATLTEDTTKIGLIDLFQNDLTENYSYSNSRENYISKTPGLHLFWKMIRDKNIPDWSRRNFYTAFLERIEVPYYTGYIIDKRSAIISENYLAPMLSDDYCFVPLLNDDTFHILWPKRDNISLYRNELPFYFEGTTMLLMHPDDFLVGRTALSERFRTITTPTSEMKHNQRSHTALVKIDLDSNQVNAICKINLSGQFSTLTRSLYDGDTSFTKINKAYNTTIGDTWNSKNIELIKTKSNSKFPYQCKVNASADLSPIIHSQNGEIEITLNGLINHITTDIQKQRTLDYYFDFKGSDSYTYMFQFASAIKLQNPIDIIVNHEEIQYIFALQQINQNTIKLVSIHNVTAQKVDSESYFKIAEVFEAINKQSEYKIKLSPVEI